VKGKLRLSISGKLVGAFLGIAVLQFAFCFYAIRQMDTVGGYFDYAYTNLMQSRDQWARLGLVVSEIKSLLNYHVAEDDSATRRKTEERIAQRFKEAFGLLEQGGSKALSDSTRRYLTARAGEGADYSETDLTHESTERLLDLLRFHLERLETLSGDVIISSNGRAKDKAANALNAGEGLETFAIVEEIVSIFGQRASREVASHHDDSMKLRDRIEFESIAVSFGTTFVAIAVGFLISRGITRPIGQLVHVFDRLAYGERVDKVENTREDEAGRLLDSMNLIIDSNQRIIDQANTIAEGDYSAEMTPRSDEDELVIALNKMTENLRDVSTQNETDRWLKTGQAELSDTMRGELDLATLSKNVVNYLAKYLDAQVGVMYLADTDGTLRLTGSYAFMQRKRQANEIRPGEGIVGQTALEKEMISISQVPEDYVTVNSGLGESAPRNIVAVPVVLEDTVKGVLELGSFESFSNAKIELLGLVSENVAIAINSAQDRETMNALLDKSQRQAEELQSQQEELKAANEELEEQTQALKQSEERLKCQSEELQATNEELEEKSEYLQQQKANIEEKNRELEAARRDIEEKAHDLELASKYKSEFLANMSHELRTPLNSLLILSKALADNEEGNLTDKQRESANVIHSGGKDLLNLINDILDLSKVEAGKLSVQFEDVDLDTVTQRLKVQFDPMAKQKGLRFQVDIEEGLPRKLITDGQRVAQILKNLLSNAIKFTSEGAVTLSIYRPGNNVQFGKSGLTADGAIALSVIDTGIGIPKDRQRAIFESFQQADGSTSRRYGGTGLGLTISRELSRLLGGEIHLQSSQGQGSTFTLYLPYRPRSTPAEAPAAERAASTTTPSALTADFARAPARSPATCAPPFLADDRARIGAQDKTILIIEDDARFAEILMEFSRKRGYKCLVAGDGRSGLQMAFEQRPSGIILDIGLPDVDGLTLLDRLKNRPETQQIPVHVISAAEESAASLRKGAIGYVTKPANAATIDTAFSKIESLLQAHVKEVLLVEKNQIQRKNLANLIDSKGIKTTGVGTGEEACQKISFQKFDCIILELDLPDISGLELLRRISGFENAEMPPVIVHTGKDITRKEYAELNEYARSIVLKGADSQERVFDDVSLFLHSVKSSLPNEQQEAVRMLHNPDQVLEGKKALLVDDDMRNTFALSAVLEKAGLEVVLADNGKMALEKLQAEGDIDLVVMDIMMPVMDGHAAMRAIRAQQQFEKLPIIALTAKAMPEDRAQCLQSGANDYLTKPVDVDKLLSLMRVWLFSRKPAAV